MPESPPRYAELPSSRAMEGHLPAAAMVPGPRPQWRGIFIDARIVEGDEVVLEARAMEGHPRISARTGRLGAVPQWRGIFIDARIPQARSDALSAAMQGHLYRCPNAEQSG